jgi:Mrp family chromosome partitioning ATPase
LVTDAAILSTIVDGTILVCAAGKTEIDAIKATKAALDKVNANIIGVVMNKVPIKKSEYYSY